MDWGKAKSILIVTFLLLNISLGYQLYLKNQGNIQNNHLNTNNIQEIKEILKQQEITIDTAIPLEVPEMHFLQIKNNTYANYLEIPNDNKVTDITLHYVETKLRENTHSFESYEYNPDESNGKDYFVFNQVEQGIPFFGAKIEARVNENGTIIYSQNYYEIRNQGSNREVISSYSALRTVLDQQLIPKGAKIEKIILGYHGTEQSSIQLLTPVWEIEYSYNGESFELYVNAMSGGIQNVINY